MSMTTAERIARYTEDLTAMTSVELIAEYERVVRHDAYGSHTDQLAIIRNSMLSRMGTAK
jgi:hypothetical protein